MVIAALPLGKRHGTNFIGGCVGSRAGLGGCEKSLSRRDSNAGPSSSYQVAEVVCTIPLIKVEL